MFRCFTRDELRINRCILTISNLTNELSLNYTINNRFVESHIFHQYKKGQKMLSYASNNISILHSHNLHSCLTTFLIFCQFTLLLNYIFYLLSIYTLAYLSLNYVFYLLSIYTLAYLHFLSSVNLHSRLSTFFIFCQFTLALIYVFYQIHQFTPFLLFLY